MIKKLMIFAVAVLSTVGIINSVYAYSEIGSVTIVLEDGVNGTSINGVEFELIQVGNVVDGLYEYTEDFSDEKTDLNKVEKADEMEELAIKLDKVADEKKIEGYLNKTDETGYLKFSALEVGIYMLRVTDYAEYEYVEPTLITVPTYNEGSQNSMNFDVVVIPKHTPFKVEISKQDITDHKELEGAELEITDKDGNVVDKWVSGKEPHMIQNLYCGESYTLIETIAPINYKVAQSINFTVDETGEVQKIVMYDELLPAAKKTGDDAYMQNYVLLGMISIVILLIGLKPKKNNV